MAAITEGLTFIKAEEFTPVVRDGLDKNKITVVDVRSDDFAGGNIKGAINFPSTNFSNDEQIDSLIEQVSKTNSTQVVFHCGKSLQRGPTCAKEFIRRLNESNKFESNPLEVKILEGGYERWESLNKGDTDVIENARP